jgi:hypothetical protein
MMIGLMKNMPHFFLVNRSLLSLVVLLPCALAPVSLAQDQAATPGGAAWKFAVSGDSRNCGDIVMPAIADKGIRL